MVLKLEDRISDALNEARTLILSVQILFGFQFNAIFQAKFTRLPAYLQSLDAAAFALMLVAAALLIAPVPFHRLAENEEESARLDRVTTILAAGSLLPLALCMGIDEFIVVTAVIGVTPAAALGGALTLMALLSWYGIEAMKHGFERLWNARRQRAKRRPISTEEKIKTLETEIRVVLPGAQALLGFQFSAILTEAFDRLPDAARYVHLASLTCIALAVVLLVAPAAYHRIATAGGDSADVDRFGTRSAVAALVPLALGMTGDVYLVIGVVTQWNASAIVAAAAALTSVLGLWFAYPLAARLHRRRGRHT